jgi:undecaprenyl-diphosphatase
MSPGVAAILGVVEGLTEYLPVSSTGHLVLAGHFLGVDEARGATFEIVIQLGAVLAVVFHYRALLARRTSGLLRLEKASVELLLALLVAFVPIAVLGLTLRKTIQAHLFGPVPVAVALAVGGVVMLLIENRRDRQASKGLVGLEHVTVRRAAWIGLGQCFALWPGTSRSMSTIVAAQLTGLSTATAAEFSFLLALPTLGSATLYEAWKSRAALLDPAFAMDIIIGLVVSFVVALLVIAGFLKYLERRGLAPFAYYRIALAVVVLWALGR